MLDAVTLDELLKLSLLRPHPLSADVTLRAGGNVVVEERSNHLVDAKQLPHRVAAVDSALAANRL